MNFKTEERKINKKLCPECQNELSCLGDSGLVDASDKTPWCKKCWWFDDDF